MRLVVMTALAVALAAVGPARAEDPPEGSIGVQIKIDEGKIVVVEPVKDGPAEKAGIKAGDVIVKVDDFKVKDNVEQEDLVDTVKEIVKHKPGTKIKLGIQRDGKDMTIEVTVGKRSEIFPPKDKD
jgi:carboxyl-terminal processing protease